MYFFIIFCEMKKNIIIWLSLLFCFLYGCWDKQATPINDQNRKSENWFSADKTFNNQIEDTQYILDLQDFFQEKDKESIKTKINAKFDEKSNLQWWFNFSKDKILIWKDENSEITFDITANSTQNNKEPFESSWSLSLLYKENEVYVQLHNFWLFMWEENINAKMYTLLLDLVHDKRVNLEVHSGWIIQIDEKSNPWKLAENLKNILIISEKEWQSEFLSNLSEFIETINWYIDLWISAEELSIDSPRKLSYSELNNEIIQKEFTWHFKSKESAFDLSFIASKKWININIFNMKTKNDEIFEDLDSEFSLLIEETDNWEYKFNLESSKLKQKVIDFEWTIKYWDNTQISWIFVLEPIEIIAGQKISWKLSWTILKDISGDFKLPELTWNILSFNELLNSLQ